MAALVPCLDALRSEFTRNFPQRDKTSDGWIGDSAHQASKSDHNPDPRGLVHAVDIDVDLRSPGVTMRHCVDEVVRRHREGQDDRLTYVIYERTIWSAAHDWRPRAYAGANPHDKHAHFSASYFPARESRRAPFGVEDIMTKADRDEIVARVLQGVDQRVDALAVQLLRDLPPSVWRQKLLNPYSGAQQDAGVILSYAPSKQVSLDILDELIRQGLREAGDDQERRAELAALRAEVQAARAELAAHQGSGPA